MVTSGLWLSPLPSGLDLGGGTGFGVMHGINQDPKASEKNFIPKKHKEKKDNHLPDLSEVACQLFAYSPSTGECQVWLRILGMELGAQEEQSSPFIKLLAKLCD